MVRVMIIDSIIKSYEARDPFLPNFFFFDLSICEPVSSFFVSFSSSFIFNDPLM